MNVPGVVPETVRVAVPEPVTLAGLIVAVRPADGVAVRATTPAKPLTAVTVIVEVPVPPVVMLIVVGLAAMVKSWTLKVTLAV